jgi:plasmid stabilization system protein ParE
MPRVIPSRLAVLDLERLRIFLREKNPEASKNAVKAIKDTFRKIGETPDIYRPVLDMPYHREAVIDFGRSGYLARFYYKPGGDVVILRVWHQREARNADNNAENK